MKLRVGLLVATWGLFIASVAAHSYGDEHKSKCENTKTNYKKNTKDKLSCKKNCASCLKSAKSDCDRKDKNCLNAVKIDDYTCKTLCDTCVGVGKECEGESGDICCWDYDCLDGTCCIGCSTSDCVECKKDDDCCGSYVCKSGTCKLLEKQGGGEYCCSGDDCESGACFDGVCAPECSLAGEQCNTGEDGGCCSDEDLDCVDKTCCVQADKECNTSDDKCCRGFECVSTGSGTKGTCNPVCGDAGATCGGVGDPGCCDNSGLVCNGGSCCLVKDAVCDATNDKCCKLLGLTCQDDPNDSGTRKICLRDPDLPTCTPAGAGGVTSDACSAKGDCCNDVVSGLDCRPRTGSAFAGGKKACCEQNGAGNNRAYICTRPNGQDGCDPICCGGWCELSNNQGNVCANIPNGQTCPPPPGFP